MLRLQRVCLIAGLLVEILLSSAPCQAQYSANYQTNTISGVASNWVGSSYVVGGSTPGSGPFADVLLIQNGGVFTPAGIQGITLGWTSNDSVVVTDPGSALISANSGILFGLADSTIGGSSLVISNGGKLFNFGDAYDVEGSNSIVVTDSGSVWSNSAGLFLGGASGSGSSLVIRHAGLVVNSQISSAQIGYMAGSSNNSVLVTDPGSIWTNGFSSIVDIGEGGNGNSLVISNGGTVFDSSPRVGDGATAYGNSVQVVGHGSVWNNYGTAMTIGYFGSSNSLVIGNGGYVFDNIGYVGRSNGFNNSVLVSDFNTVWSNASTLYIGLAGVGGSLVITNHAKVFDASAVVGSQLGSSSNTVQLVPNDGLWQNGVLTIGDHGSSNSLVIHGGSVLATSLTIGLESPTCDNLVALDSGTLTVTNNGAGVLEVRNGQLILKGGILRVDTLVITNSCASFVHTGGTLIAGNVVLDPNTFRITSITRQGNDLLVTWLMGPGQMNTLQVTSGDANGNYATNGFTDIFIVTNNTTVGTVTNYLDIGAATNAPSRFYRAHLVP